MDLITQNFLNTFVTEHGRTTLPPERQFEHFASYITVRQQYKEAFDTADIATGGSGDTGIDAVAVLVNGQLVTDVDELDYATADGAANLDVMFLFVQAERSQHFDGAKITTFGDGVIDFFRPVPTLPRNPQIQAAASLAHTIYQRAEKFVKGRPSCRLYYVTTGIWQGDQTLEARRTVVCADLTNLNLFEDVEFAPVDANRIRQLFTESKNAISRTFDFPKKQAAPDIKGVTQAFVGYITARAFRSIITDSTGEILRSIVYDNVRDWQGDNAVNAAMAETLTSDIRDRFLLMNNGVTVIARTLQQVSERVTINDYQIVNGCQTSHVVFQNVEENSLDSVMVPLRVIATEDEEVIASIIKATNSQTSIPDLQFLAITDFQEKLESFFSALTGDKRLYYERRTGQYGSLSVERVRIVTPVQLIRAFAAMFLNEPHGTTRSFRRIRERIGTEIFNPNDKLDPYYAAALAHYRLEFLFRNQRVDTMFKPARYHLMLAVRILAEPTSKPKMNSHEMERYCSTLTNALWDVDAADALFAKASNIVFDVARALGAMTTGVLDRDIVRTEPFTTAVTAKTQTAKP